MTSAENGMNGVNGVQPTLKDLHFVVKHSLKEQIDKVISTLKEPSTTLVDRTTTGEVPKKAAYKLNEINLMMEILQDIRKEINDN